MSTEPAVDGRRPEGVEARPMGWWGTLLTSAVVLTSYAAMCFAYVYVRIASNAWPPAGIEPPETGTAILAGVALLATVPPMAVAARRAPAHAFGPVRLSLLAALVLGGAHIALLLADQSGQPFGVGTHAYGSLYYVLPGIHMVVLAIGMLVAAVLLALTWHDQGPGLVHVGTLSLRVYWYTAVLGGVVLLAFVYGVPHVWREAIPA